MVQQSPRRLELTVTADQAGEKIDTLLRRELRLSGTVIRRVKWLDDGILLDGMRVTTGHRPAAGQVLSVRVADPDGQGDMVPTPGPLDIVYEDGDLLVLNKAPGVLVHPGPGHYSDTLCNYIAWYYKKAGISADVHPVQRLDKGTSGLLVVAKHPHAQEQLKRQLHTPAFRRIYLAVCEGIPRPAEGHIDAPIGRVPGSLMARRVDPAGQPAGDACRQTGAGRPRSCADFGAGRSRPAAHPRNRRGSGVGRPGSVASRCFTGSIARMLRLVHEARRGSVSDGSDVLRMTPMHPFAFEKAKSHRIRKKECLPQGLGSFWQEEALLRSGIMRKIVSRRDSGLRPVFRIRCFLAIRSLVGCRQKESVDVSREAFVRLACVRPSSSAVRPEELRK